MARLLGGSTDVPSAGTRVQLSATRDKLKKLYLRAHPSNSGVVFFGAISVSATNGYALSAGGTLNIDYGQGSELFENLYVDAATNGDDLTWVALLES